MKGITKTGAVFDYIRKYHVKNEFNFYLISNEMIYGDNIMYRVMIRGVSNIRKTCLSIRHTR